MTSLEFLKFHKYEDNIFERIAAIRANYLFALAIPTVGFIDDIEKRHNASTIDVTIDRRLPASSHFDSDMGFIEHHSHPIKTNVGASEGPDSTTYNQVKCGQRWRFRVEGKGIIHLESSYPAILSATPI